MESNVTTCKSRDILSSRWRVFILYWLPAIAIVVAGVPAVSSGCRGRPYSANKLRERKLRPLLTGLRIPLAGFHAFRHAVASELIDSGAPITVVQAQLRHSDPRITLGLYGHVIPQSQRDALGRLAARLANTRRTTGLQLLTRPRIADSAA